MKNERNFKILAVVALIIGGFSLAIAYASFTSSLTISGSATLSSAWKIVWDDLSSGTATGYASVTGKTLAIDSSKQSISGSLGTLKAPGDTITYTWNIENQGDIDATLSGLAKGSLSCAPASTNGSTSAEATSVCSKLSISYKYNNVAITTGTTGLSTALNKGTTIPVTMTLTYSDASTTTLSGNVAVTISSTTFTYVQK